MYFNKISKWSIWLVASFFYAYQYTLRVMPNIMISDIMTKFDIDASMFGQFSGIYYLGYSLMHVPLGILLDRFGPKKIMPIFMSLTLIGTLPLICTNFWLYPILGRFLVGVGSSAAILGVFKIVRMSFSESRFAIMLSWSVTIGLLGAIYGGAPVNYLKDLWGFQTVVLVLLVCGAVLSILSFFIMPTHIDEAKRSSVWHDIKMVIGNKKVLAVCILAGLMVGPLEGFADVWGSTFLQTVYGLDENIAASLPSFIFLGMACGGPFLSYIAAKTNYLSVILLCALLMGLCFVFLLLGSIPTAALALLFGFIGVLCAYQIIAIYKASTYVPSSLAGLASAVANMIIMTFGYIFHSTMGAVIDAFSARDGYSPLDSVVALRNGVSVIPFAMFLAMLGFLYLVAAERKAKD